MRIVTPNDIAKPASNYAQGMVHTAGADRLIISGQVGMRPDGTLAQGMRAQMEQCWRNFLGVVRGAGFERQHVAKIVMYVTEPGQIQLFREIRDKYLEGHLCASTFLQVAGLARSDFLCELEGEAVKE
jgi:2-iminobutanoate/2-iminopropanoate deaminase